MVVFKSSKKPIAGAGLGRHAGKLPTPLNEGVLDGEKSAATPSARAKSDCDQIYDSFHANVREAKFDAANACLNELAEIACHPRTAGIERDAARKSLVRIYIDASNTEEAGEWLRNRVLYILAFSATGRPFVDGANPEIKFDKAQAAYRQIFETMFQEPNPAHATLLLSQHLVRGLTALGSQRVYEHSHFEKKPSLESLPKGDERKLLLAFAETMLSLVKFKFSEAKKLEVDLSEKMPGLTSTWGEFFDKVRDAILVYEAALAEVRKIKV